ncbi:hypothetical protein [Sphingopyxis sp. KK2]|uniref:hypothetical protein n=1 Tax=Sphingopyxis sp. KK2 TaxID=1855727 RepID=UPI001181BE9A|nr:hypothetical protein [Sphingopyxis sp. KK2]
MTMRRAAALLLPAMLLVTPPPVAATSIVATPPHRTDRACALAADIFAGLVANASPRPNALLAVIVTTDALGTTTWEDKDALAAELGSHNGKPDRVPPRLLSLRRIDDGGDKTQAIYVATLERDRWELERYMGDDGLLMPVYEPDPHYEVSTGAWLVTFRGNQVTTLREADELWPLARGDAALDCRGATNPTTLGRR